MKRKGTILLFVFGVCIACSPKVNSSLVTDRKNAEVSTEMRSFAFQDSLINYGMNYLNTPYRFGGTNANGFDCSGFTSFVYRKFGYHLDHSSSGQAKQFPAISKKDLKIGDLVFFEGRRHSGRIGHVGIVTELKDNNEFRFIHSTIGNGVIVSSSTEPYYASRYVNAGRVALDRLNLTNFNLNFVPSKTAESTSDSFNRNDDNDDADNAIYHTVVKGENLYKIAEKYDVPVSTIQALNHLKSKKIKAGQKLLISEGEEEDNATVKPTSVSESNSNVEVSVQLPKAASDSPIKENPVAEAAQANTLNVASTTIPPSNRPLPQKTNQNKTLEAEKVPTATNSTNFSSTETKHKVAAGETLYTIAKKYGLNVDDLKAWNGITDNTIKTGQLLSVRKVENQPATTARIHKTQSSKNNRQIHIVKKGESLYSIARKYDCKVNDLRKWNPSLSDNIHAGDKIKIEHKK